MKCAILLALVAFANASPLFWGHDVGYPISGLWMYQHDELEPTGPHGLTRDTICDQLSHIKELQWRLGQYPSKPFGLHQRDHVHEMCGEQAAAVFHHLNYDLPNHHHQQHVGVETFHPTHFSLDNVHNQPGFNTEIFQKFANEQDEHTIEMQISHHHHWAQQLHDQQQLVHQQKHQIEDELQHVGVSGQLEGLHEKLHQQECELIKEQLAHHIAVLELQVALIHQQVHVLEETVEEHDLQSVGYMGGKLLPKWI